MRSTQNIHTNTCTATKLCKHFDTGLRRALTLLFVWINKLIEFYQILSKSYNYIYISLIQGESDYTILRNFTTEHLKCKQNYAIYFNKIQPETERQIKQDHR